METTYFEKLATLLDSKIEGIEIVPAAGLLPTLEDNPHAPFLLIEGHLGVPQKALYLAYLGACRTFASAKGTSDAATILRASSVLLLANAAHSTALNARKRLVLSGLRDVRLELDFTGSLLSEQQAAKSSFLWHHRRWLLRHLYSDVNGVPDGSAEDLDTCVVPFSQLRVEVALAEQASETYRRNYFAWNHRLRCIRNLRLHLGSERSSAFGFLHSEIGAVRSWIDRHISDHTAMHYVCELVSLYGELLPEGSQTLHEARATLDHAYALVSSFPSHESLWLYVRRSLAVILISEPDAAPITNARLHDLLINVGTLEDDHGAHIPLPGTEISSCSTGEQVHAVRCARWLRLRQHPNLLHETRTT
ncbi:protein prenylyltransferase [Exidia glandulosa HHB12029]|uniref:Protein prenylyltransferase n=1 Tax=Exidia glandulosa HHB12029 TaxID=1314781 RepID=A0A165EZ54_EXIGL|nr:protein prenylyltransferase [Exidia glandulosa HHB12029]